MGRHARNRPLSLQPSVPQPSSRRDRSPLRRTRPRSQHPSTRQQSAPTARQYPRNRLPKRDRKTLAPRHPSTSPSSALLGPIANRSKCLTRRGGRPRTRRLGASRCSPTHTSPSFPLLTVAAKNANSIDQPKDPAAKLEELIHYQPDGIPSSDTTTTTAAPDNNSSRHANTSPTSSSAAVDIPAKKEIPNRVMPTSAMPVPTSPRTSPRGKTVGLGIGGVGVTGAGGVRSSSSGGGSGVGGLLQSARIVDTVASQG